MKNYRKVMPVKINTANTANKEFVVWKKPLASVVNLIRPGWGHNMYYTPVVYTRITHAILLLHGCALFNWHIFTKYQSSSQHQPSIIGLEPRPSPRKPQNPGPTLIKSKLQ